MKPIFVKFNQLTYEQLTDLQLIVRQNISEIDAKLEPSRELKVSEIPPSIMDLVNERIQLIAVNMRISNRFAEIADATPLFF